MATTARRRNAHPMSYYRDMVQDMDDNQKLELITILVQSMQPAVALSPMKRYSMDEINAMLDEAEAEIAAGGGVTHDEVMREWDDEIARWEQEDMKMAEAI